MIVIHDIIPVAKPRMTQRDRWLNPPRPAVARYRAYCDELTLKMNILGFELPESNYWITFYLPMAKSWSKDKKEAHEGQRHQQTPDKDNLEKAFLDALFKEDCRVWDGRVTKRWSVNPRIEIATCAELDYFKKRADYWDKTILGDIAKGAFLPPEDLLSIVGEVAQARLGELNKTVGPKP